MFLVKPAPCFLTTIDTPIRDVVLLMAEHKSSYALIQDSQGQVAGIFTVRDLLLKFATISDPQNQAKPISTLMTRPVLTIGPHLIHTAPEFLQKHGFHHLPIVGHNADAKRDELLGIITRDAIFESLVNTRGFKSLFANSTTTAPVRTIGVISPDGSVFTALSHMFQATVNVSIERLWLAELQTDQQIRAVSKECTTIIIDIDGAPANKWTATLKLLNHLPFVKFVCVLMDPKLHAPEVVQIIEKLKGLSWLHVYLKPVDMSAMLLDIDAAWNAKKP